MPKIVIISASIRKGRKSDRVASFLKNYITENNLASAEIIDLKELNFPLFEERLKFQDSPLQSLIDYAQQIKQCDGVIVVTPEYNGGYPASLKNAIDVLVDEWYHKPIAISTVSNGIFGGSQVITSLQFSLWKIRAITVPAMFPIPKVEEAFDENGTPKDVDGTNKRAATFVKELLWFIEAKNKMQ